MYSLVMAMVLLYYLLFIVYYQSIFPAQRRRIVQVVLTLVFVVASYVSLNARDLLLFNFPTVMVIMIVGLRFSTSMNWRQAIYGGGTCAITAYCFRGIFTAVASFFYKSFDFLFDATAYYMVTLFALPAALLLLRALRRTIITDDKLKKFMNNDSQLKIVIVYELVAVSNLVTIHSGRSLSPNSTWYMQVALGAFVLTLFMLVYAVYQSIRSTELLEYQWQTKALENQLDLQLQHYRSYQKYTKSFREFRHDYKFMMSTVKALIRVNDNQKALRLLDDIYDDMQKKVQMHKKYSNDMTLDAILQDLANICTEKEIRFTFNAFILRSTKLTLLDAVRIFSNITNNAVEACEKVPVSERFIKITSRNDQQWVTLEVINSFDGHVIIQDGKLITTKVDQYSHGFGLGIVHEIAENLGGFVIYDTNIKNKTFLVRVHIPYFKNTE